ncbi:hypothetical protein EVAR_4593_1 [Eumeta japonica]|uniref:Uncharacterized protein n=1 Tax=Eumeta variegata TaxID=151549 RepID=A0A4C1SWA5_EUMVA|nr:hypothetical protein EVAR_4593_1 [Eumeta japonica]
MRDRSTPAPPSGPDVKPQVYEFTCRRLIETPRRNAPPAGCGNWSECRVRTALALALIGVELDSVPLSQCSNLLEIVIRLNDKPALGESRGLLATVVAYVMTMSRTGDLKRLPR